MRWRNPRMILWFWISSQPSPADGMTWHTETLHMTTSKWNYFVNVFFQSPHLITVDHLWSSINSSLSILVICLLQQISKHPLTSSPALTSRVSALTATAPKEVLLHRGAAKAEPLGDIGINDQCAPLRIRNHNIHIDLHGLIYYIPN